VLVRDSQRIDETAREITRVLRERHALAAGQPDDFNVLTPVEVQRMFGRAKRILSIYLPMAAGVALLVGGIVAATLMLASVSARVGEIGLRRAVGAQPADIWYQFLVETTITTLGGGLCGLVLGLAASQAMAVRLQLGPVFSWQAVGLAIAMSGATGLLAGVWPARRAARLLPADALR
jgi:putative ABC transport system permease protein